MEARKRNKSIALILMLILVVALLLRVFNIGHSLGWDETWNANSIVDAATGHTDRASTFYPNFLRHPPAYTGLGVLYALMTGSDRSLLAIALEILSIICALGLVLVIYLCGRDWFGATAGLCAAFLFAVMPAARVFDTWVKQESMTLLFSTLFLLFFFRKKYVTAGVFLGLSFLTKEICVFVPLALFVFLLVRPRAGRLKGFALSALVALPIAAWWYIFFSESAGEFTAFFLGRDASARVWHQSWNLYIARIPSDIGWGALAAVVIGVFFMLWRYKQFRGVKPPGDAFAGRDMALFASIWIVVVYVPLSVSFGKPPWMIYSALPAFALLGGWGLSDLYSALSGKKLLAGAAVGVVLLLALWYPPSFLPGADVMYSRTSVDRRVAEYINRKAGPGAKTMSRDSELSPITAFYLDSYLPGSIALLPLDDKDGEADPGKSLFLLDDRTNLEQLVDAASEVEPDYVVLRSRSALARDVEKMLKPVEIGDVFVFDGRELGGLQVSQQVSGAPTTK